MPRYKQYNLQLGTYVINISNNNDNKENEKKY